MASSQSRRRTPRLHKSLCVLLPALYGKIITVELKDDTEVTGTLAEASVTMGMTLMAARRLSVDGRVVDLDVVFLKGTTVRFVHIPVEINPIKALADGLNRTERIMRAGDKSKRTGGSRAMKHRPALDSSDDEA